MWSRADMTRYVSVIASVPMKFVSTCPFFFTYIKLGTDHRKFSPDVLLW